jgi:hypothetical protein
LAVIVIDRPRFGVEVELVDRNAFISKPTPWLTVKTPSVAVTCEVYFPAAAARRPASGPLNVNECVPASRTPSAMRVSTTSPAAFRIVQVTVPGD